MKTLRFEDIEKIGHTAHAEDSCTVLSCSVETANIEELFLREILSLRNYQITEIDEEIRRISGWPSHEYVSIIFRTNVPWEVFQEARKTKIKKEANALKIGRWGS
jgi:hypothetical protein